MKENPLKILMDPRSIATVGAGNNPTKMGAIQALSIVKDGYRGKFFPIHPSDKTVLGHKAYPSVMDLPETPDLAIFIVPTDQVLDLVEQFGKIGTKRAVVITAGFRETGSAGLEREVQLKEIARRYGIRFIGPNCIGLLNSAISLNITVMPMQDPPGLLGMASQSGTYVTQTFPYLKKRGIRFSKAISLGNEADININDALAYLGEDDQTKAIALYIEGLKDPEAFLRIAQEITPHKPVLAQYVGGTVAGARAGSSHTGAMAGPDHLYDGLLQQAGIIRVYSVEDLYGQGWALATQPPLKGKRIGVITNSGGPGTAMSDACNAGGLEVPIFSEQLQEQIRPHIPPHGARANPVDLTFFLDAQMISVTIPEMIINSGEVDGIVLHGAMGTGFMNQIYTHAGDLFGLSREEFLATFRDDLSAAMELPKKYDFPFLVSSFFDERDDYTAAYRKRGIPVYDSPEKTARAMVALWKYRQIRQRNLEGRPILPQAESEATEVIAEAQKRGAGMLDEFSSKRVLAAYGIPTSAEKLVFSAAEAAAGARSLGYPVVLKGCSEEIAHKTGKGLIHLNLKEEAAVRRSFEEIWEAAGEEIPVLVARMVRGDRELVAGALRHPGFGSCVMFGLGGIFTEVLRDTLFRLAPLSRKEAMEMLDGIRAKDLLGEFRGMPAADREALTSILQKVGDLLLIHPEIKEIDLNPIILEGSRPVVVDALITF
ncbi:MAG: acetate--CoA ligase family protein [Firmicutes bacterium]|nr:acetate--CoA ligase family protein [Bacillota bacterium]